VAAMVFKMAVFMVPAVPRFVVIRVGLNGLCMIVPERLLNESSC
jgi:hypothetical protein